MQAALAWRTSVGAAAAVTVADACVRAPLLLPLRTVQYWAVLCQLASHDAQFLGDYFVFVVHEIPVSSFDISVRGS
jgi:hypothetical protein